MFIFCLSSFPLPGEDYVFFESVGKEDGLSNLAVSSIVQDSRGFLWFGTQGGLNRYDGYRFKVYKKKPFDRNSLSHDLIQTLYMDEDDILWIGTYSGLNRLDLKTEKFTRFKNIPGDPESLSNDVVVSVTRDREGNLWAGTLNGLNRLDEETNTFRQYLHEPNNPGSLNNNTVRSLYTDSAGNLWIGSYGGLNRYRPGTDDFVSWQHEEDNQASIASNNVMAIAEAEPGELWLATWGGGGLSCFDITSGTAENYDLPDNRSYSIDVRETGTVFIGTWGGGLVEFEAGSQSHELYTFVSYDSSSISHDIVYSLYMDPSEILWIGTNGGGINKMKKPDTEFRYWTHNPDDHDSISMGKITTVFRDSFDDLWIGTYNGGLNRYDPENERMIHYRTDMPEPHRISNDIITHIMEDSRKNLWVCTNQGLNRYLREEDRFERWFDEKSDNPLPDQIVYGILEDSDRSLWIGTYNSGVVHYYFDTGEMTHYSHDQEKPRSLSDNLVYSLFLDRKNNLWIGTNNGLNRYYRESDDFTRYYHDPDDEHTLTSSTVREIYEDGQDNLWIGTISGGLNLLDRESGLFSHYMVEDGLPSNTIYGMLEDNRGRIWLSTMTNIVIFDPVKKSFQIIDEDKGLRSREFSRGHFADMDGRLLYFGSTEGLYAIETGDFRQNTHVPPVYLTSFKIFDQEVSFDRALQEIRSIEVDYRDKFIAFEFAALDYVNPDKNRYAYKLEGFDEDWISSDRRRYASYTNLAPGRYTFRVRASNSDQVWNMNGLSIDLRVIPPVWRSSWAYSFYLVSFIAMIYIIVLLIQRYQKQRFQRETQKIELQRLGELEKEVQERRRVEAELTLARDEAERANRTKSSFIANISHEIRTPLNAIIGYTHMIRRETDKKNIHGSLDIIKKSGNQLLNLINDLLDLSVIESGKLRIHSVPMKLDEVAEDIYSTYRYRMSEKGLELEVHIQEGTPDTIYADSLRIRQILFNLVGNALKFTEQGKIEVLINGRRIEDPEEEEAGQGQFAQIWFQVRDTGIGIPEDVQESIFEAFSQRKEQSSKYGGTGLGLAIARDLSSAMGGNISVESEPGTGSVFTVYLPRIRVFSRNEPVQTSSPSILAGPEGPHRPEIKRETEPFTGKAQNCRVLLEWLETEAYPWWEEISGSLFIDDWNLFSSALITRGDTHRSDDLISFGNTLKNCILHSQLAEMSRVGADFPVLLAAIKRQCGE